MGTNHNQAARAFHLERPLVVSASQILGLVDGLDQDEAHGNCNDPVEVVACL